MFLLLINRLLHNQAKLTHYRDSFIASAYFFHIHFVIFFQAFHVRKLCFFLLLFDLLFQFFLAFFLCFNLRRFRFFLIIFFINFRIDPQNKHYK